ncbi:hypothetical protein SAMN05421870_118114 [Streptomyces qinglanensis]|uniref:Uncharacterized protein n=1 Tax=Streptomyces qinglanensis TaxID=943816 RepID=A0A1H9WKC9_9ACTN|nr:hypothetical protein SAMN05421870_118114 [Streptomyces qinglanensis]
MGSICRQFTPCRNNLLREPKVRNSIGADEQLEPM